MTTHVGDMKRMTVRALEALTVFAADLEPRAAADVHDSVASLLDVCWGAAPDAPALASWAVDAERVVRRCMSEVPTASALHAVAQTVRLQALAASVRVSSAPVSTRNSATTPRKVPAPRVAKKLPARTASVLAFIRTQGGCRSKEAIDNFAGKLSARSVKRSLNELIETGALTRVIVEGISRYEPIDAQG